MREVVAWIGASIALAGTAWAAAPTLQSQVYQAPGLDQATLARRAVICIPQTVQAAPGDSPTQIRSTDPGGGLVMADAHFSYSFLGQMRVRTTLTFEAKPERFRITYTGTTLGNPWNDNWVGFEQALGWGKGRALDQMNKFDEQIAECISKAAGANDW